MTSLENYFDLCGFKMSLARYAFKQTQIIYFVLFCLNNLFVKLNTSNTVETQANRLIWSNKSSH